MKNSQALNLIQFYGSESLKVNDYAHCHSRHQNAHSGQCADYNPGRAAR
ncbi:hypothetical protein [Endozoicomonas sp. SESOKO4]|nr:hypothetical protein [Endozoicomonas sp. SESOKO4]